MHEVDCGFNNTILIVCVKQVYIIARVLIYLKTCNSITGVTVQLPVIIQLVTVSLPVIR